MTNVIGWIIWMALLLGNLSLTYGVVRSLQNKKPFTVAILFQTISFWVVLIIFYLKPDWSKLHLVWLAPIIFVFITPLVGRLFKSRSASEDNPRQLNIEEKRKIAFRIWNWGAQPVKFVRDYLRDNLDIDEPRLRSHYILLSYGFEMILKSRVAMLLNVQDKDTLNEKLQKLGHNFVKISDILGSESKNIGITKIELKTAKCNDPKSPDDEYSYFIIETVDGKKISIENFTDIRYGCIGGGMRIIDKEEHKKILEYTTAILEIWGKIKTANDDTH